MSSKSRMSSEIPFNKKQYFDHVFDIMRSINNTLHDDDSNFGNLKKEITKLLETSMKVLRMINVKLKREQDKDEEISKNNQILSELQGLDSQLNMVTDKEGLKSYFKKIVNFENNYRTGGGRRNQSKYADVKMKVIKGLCKANNIKLSRVIDGKRVPYNKKELLTKLKRKKII
jgi:regulator of replication initiation timing